MIKIIIWTQFLSSLYETIHHGMIFLSPSQESHFVWHFSGKGASHTYVIILKTVHFLLLMHEKGLLFLLYECISLVIDLSKGTIYHSIKLSAMCLCTFSLFKDLWCNHE